MVPMLKSLLGNGSKDQQLIEEMRAVVEEMRHERGRCESLIERSQTAADRLRELEDPISIAQSGVGTVSEGLARLEQRLEAMVQLSTRLQSLEERTHGVAEGQQRMETQIADSLENAGRVHTMFEALGQKVDLALKLKDQLEGFLEVDKPLQELRGDAEALRGQVDGTRDQLARLGAQHDRLLDAHKLGMSKMEALDRRREEFSRDLQDKERRVANVEHSVRAMDGVQGSVDSIKRELGSLKALGEFVAQKSESLEAQRDAIETALARADQLERAMKQVNTGVAQQQENEKLLKTVQRDVASLRSLHDSVLERSDEITQLQHEADEQTRATRHDLALTQDETRKTLERFDFENRGLETVSQRVADLRGALLDFENRFKSLGETSRHVAELQSQTQTLSATLRSFSNEIGHADEEIAKLKGVRRDLDEMSRATQETGAKVVQIEAARPAVEAAIRDLENLTRVHTMVKDALEQTHVVNGEIARVLASQSETRSWLTSVEQSVGEVGQQVNDLKGMAPAIEVVQKQAQRVHDFITVIDARREFVEDLSRRLSEQGALSSRLDERSRDLQSRMEAAEQRFVALSTHSEEAERLSKTIASVASGVSDSRARTDRTAKAVEAIEARCESVAELAEKTRALKQDLDHRQQSLAETAKDLERATELRQEAATAAQKLGELTKRLTGSLSTADERTHQIGAFAGQLEDRASDLQSVARRLDEFEERMARWDAVEPDVARSLEQICARQGTLDTIQTDLERMFAMAEKTAAEIREITAARSDVEQSRTMLQEVMDRLLEVQDVSSKLDERTRQMSKAEERLARADALLADMRSSVEILQGQKVLIDQAVEKTRSLRSMLKQADSAIQGLKEERDVTSSVRSAIAFVRGGDGVDSEGDETQAT